MFDAIVWASDGSAHDDRSLSVVREICERYSSSLRIVHVVERLPAASCPGLDVHACEDRTVAKLKARTSALRRHGIRASLHVVRGSLGQTRITSPRSPQPAMPADRCRHPRAVGGRARCSAALPNGCWRVAPCPILIIPCAAPSRRLVHVDAAQPPIAA
jgi:hypothetical protein